MDIGRIVQALLLTAIAAVIAGSLVGEYWAGPRIRHWRTRRCHHHAAAILPVYRSLRRKLRERRLTLALEVIAALGGEDPPLVVSAGKGQIAVLVCDEWREPALGDDN